MRYVIIGASAAGINAAQTLRKLDCQGEITVVSADERVYSRCMLHHVIAGKKDVESICFVTRDFFEKNALQWRKGEQVTEVLFKQRQILLQDGTTIGYDRILIATGAAAFIPPISGIAQAQKVFKLSDLTDVNAIIAASVGAKSALVIGAGLVGLDAASALLERGMQVAVVEMADRVLPLQLDRQSASAYQKRLEQSGASVFTGVAVQKVIPEAPGRKQSACLSNGLEIPCDIVIAAAGAKPNLSLIKDTALKIQSGISVDDRMHTSLPQVYAAGDVTGRSAIWPQAVLQGIVAAYNMAGIEKRISDHFTAKNSVNLFGLATVSLGLVNAPDSTYSEAVFNRNGIYKKVIHKDGIAYGVILQREIDHCGIWTRVIREKINISAYLPDIFNLDYAKFFQIDRDGNYHYAT